ncbi:MAG: S8 family serine peptidase [Calditrichaeota bacterium]|nr:S8 family serine peptidase [Calditrichota bacterium]
MLFALLLISLTANVFAAEFSSAIEDELKNSGKDEFISTLIFLPNAVDIRTLDFALHDRGATIAQRNREVLEALKYNAEQNQPAFKAELDFAESKGDVRGYTAYWIDNLFVVHASKSFIESLRHRGDIEYVTTNFSAELIDPIRSEVGSIRPPRRPLDNETTTTEQDAIGTTRVNRELGITGQGVIVANCDTGVDGNHPALASRWRGNFAPVSQCWRDALGSAPNFPSDGNGHGTHVMGTMTGRAISGNDTNTVGGAPNARWIATNSINQGVGSAFDNDIIADYQWFANPDGDINTTDDLPDIIQNSWGVNSNFSGYTTCDTRWNTFILNCEAAGPVITWSAGNEGASGLRTPAIHSMNAYQIFSVGAVDAQDGLPPYPIASFSSLGPTPCTPAVPDNIKPEISAPGVNIYSSVPGGGYDGTYSGTSMAGPHVAGVVALMREACPNCDHMTIKDAIMATALDQGPAGQDNTYGYGVIQAYEAVISVSNLGRIAGTVTDGTNPLDGARVQVIGSANQAITDVNGEYILPLPDGTYDLEFWKLGYEPYVVTGVTVILDDTVYVNAALNALQSITFIDEDFETGASGWTHDAPAGWVDNWHVSTERANSGTQSFKCGDTGTGTYASLNDARLTSPVMTSLPAFATLTFTLQMEAEVSGFYADSCYDGGFLEISASAGPWTPISVSPAYNRTFRYTVGGGNPYTGPIPGVGCVSGSITTWTTYTVDLSDYEGQDVQLRFRFASDANTNQEGWYVDDVVGVGYGSATPAAPTELAVVYNPDTDNLDFSWNGTAPLFKLWSSASFDGPFVTLEGSTSSNSLSIPLPVDDQLYYVVTASNGGELSIPSRPVGLNAR